MRLAIISDIHANIEALDAVLGDIDSQNIDQTICLGDLVGYGANPNECVDRVAQRSSVVLLGNHDAAAVDMLSTHHFNIQAKIAIEWTAQNLKKSAQTYLRSLPLRQQEGISTYVHSTPYEPGMWYYITSLEEAAFNFQFFETTICFIGHTHIPLIVVLDNEKELYVQKDTELDFGGLVHCRFLVNVGSVGQPRDHNTKACYGILDTEKKIFCFCRVAYDIEKTQAQMRKAKMPDFLITRLEEGR